MFNYYNIQYNVYFINAEAISQSEAKDILCIYNNFELLILAT